MNPAYLGALAIYASPSIPLGVGWWRFVRTAPKGISTQLVLIAATVSLAWLLLGSLYPVWWGPFYGHLRSAIIDANFVGMLIAAVAAFSSQPRRQIWTGVACVMLGLIWAFVASINATI